MCFLPACYNASPVPFPLTYYTLFFSFCLFFLALIDFLSVVKSGVQIRFKLKHVTNLAARAKRDGDRKKSEELIMLVKILKNYVKNNPFNAKFWSDQVWYSAKIIFKTAAVSALFSAASGAAISGYNRAVSDVNRSRSFR